MKPILKLMFFLLGITLVSAQETFTVSGTVYDFHDKTLLQNAKIQIGNYLAFSDKKGKFVVENIHNGNYTLEVTHPNCEAFSEELNVNKNIEITIALEHHAEDIETVIIHGIHKNNGSMVVKTLEKSDIERNSSDNLGNLLKNISGVSGLKTGNNIVKPIIHGLYGSRISIINNGVKMAEQEWGVEHAPNIDINNFQHIDVIKGASALKYGNESAGGIVVLEPAVIAKKDTLYGNLKFSGISNGRGGEIAADAAKIWKNQWFVRAGGGYKKLGDQYVPHHTLQNTGAEVNSFNFSFGNHSFKQGFDVSYSGINQEFGIFKGAHLSSPEDWYKAINFGQPYYLDNFTYEMVNPKQEVSHHIAKISAYKRFADLGKISLQYSFQVNHRKEYDIRKGNLYEVPAMDLRLITHSVSLNHLFEREKWSLESGISGGFQDNFPNPKTEARRLIPDYYRYDGGVFSVFKYIFSTELKAEVGARYDFSRYDSYKYYDKTDWEARFEVLFPQFFVNDSGSRILTHPILDFHNFSANAGINFTPSQHWDFKLNFSRADRSPNAAELFADGLHHSAAIMETGNLALKKEEVYNLNFSALVKSDILNGFAFEINPYIMFSDSFINQIPTGVKSTNRGIFPVWDYQQVKARIYGIDMDAHLKFTDYLKWDSSFSILKGDDLSNDEPLISMMPANVRNAVELSFDKPSHFYIRLENENAFRQSRFPIRNIDVTFIEDGNVVTKEVDYSTPPPTYTIFNAALGMDIFKNVNFNFRINNVFNKEYKEYLNRLRYFMPEPGRNFVATLQFKF